MLTSAGVKPIVMAALVLALLGGAIYFMSRRTPDADRPARETAAAPAATGPATDPAPAPARPSPGATPAAPARKTPRKAEPVASAPAPTATPNLATLVVETDVPGASVFVNRQYVGTTPLRLDRLEPGTKQLKLTADGYDGIERAVDLVAGENPLTLRFREVRLDKRIAVSHKHGMGGCDGTLVATVDGLAYESANKNDAFTLPYAQVDSLTVDYLEKNLRVKQKGGKTWNFTDKNAANADALFVFHRDVEAARKKLADGYAPVR
jgi:hypothetical protein